MRTHPRPLQIASILVLACASACADDLTAAQNRGEGPTTSATDGGDPEADDETSTGEPTPLACRTFAQSTSPKWQHRVEPEVFPGMSGMLALADGGLAVAGRGNVLRLNGAGEQLAVHTPATGGAGLGPPVRDGAFSIVAEFDRELVLTEYRDDTVSTEASLAFSEGRLWGPALPHRGGATIVTVVRPDVESPRIVQLRDETLSVRHSYVMKPGEDLGDASAAQDGSIYITSPQGDRITITAITDGQELWSIERPAEGTDPYLYPSTLAAGSVLAFSAPGAPTPLVGLAPGNGSVLWDSTLTAWSLGRAPCGTVLAAAYSEGEQVLFGLEPAGPTALTSIEPPAADAPISIRALDVGPDGTVFIAWAHGDSDNPSRFVVLAAY